LVKVGIIGGGAAGFFGALALAENAPHVNVTILEKSQNVLSKVKISGGGRCNVTNACFDINEAVKNYPRGNKELKSVFYKFGFDDTVKWFKDREIELKIEPDGRMFPVTDKSETIIQCFLKETQKLRIDIVTGYNVRSVSVQESAFVLNSGEENSLSFDKLLITTGGSGKPESYEWLMNSGHVIVEPVPSLFTFNIPESPLKGLEGISSENVEVSALGTKLKQKGPVIITHWGLSGPAILKLSAFGARELYDMDYNFVLILNWLAGFSIDKIKEIFAKVKINDSKQRVSVRPYFNLPSRLWNRLSLIAGIKEETLWANIRREEINKFLEVLTASRIEIRGKSIFKEEFVTAGGVSLKDIDFRTMQSKKCTGMYFAGEVLDIDGITGGFNFQSAWSTAHVAGSSIANNCKNI